MTEQSLFSIQASDGKGRKVHKNIVAPSETLAIAFLRYRYGSSLVIDMFSEIPIHDILEVRSLIND